MTGESKVVIIGAGAAGLAAAYRLAPHGVDTCVLEARDRIGGRIHTLRGGMWTTPIEAGAEFVHGEAIETQRLIHAGRLAVEEVADTHWNPQSPDYAEEFERAWNVVAERLKALGDEDLPFAEFLDRDCRDLTPDQRQQVTAYVEGFEAADARIVSCRWLRQAEAETGPEEGASRIRDGYDRILDGLRPRSDQACQIRLNEAVTHVRWRPGAVEVISKSADGSIQSTHASAAIITLPLGVLQAIPPAIGALHFEPDLSEKRAQWNALKVGAIVKLTLQFARPLWPESSDWTFLHTPDSPFAIWWRLTGPSVPGLVGWCAGPAALGLTGRPAAELLATGLAGLARPFGMSMQSIENELIASNVADWGNDPFSRGGYAYVPAGGVELPSQLAQNVEQTLFFAGEATHSLLTGTVEGAIASGHRAAEEFLARRNR